MSEHTPEPWKLDGRYRICSQVKVTIAACFGDNSNNDAARIVACVNGCKGINPEAVPDLLDVVEGLTRMIDQRFTKTVREIVGEGWFDLSEAASAAIAKATGDTDA